ncbi:hypothetical protein [Amycolatopsis keratiniphila]|uniref:hypothetical protein n=1 Tax=Amycolatopsis keratiniphila TaxID=129921 RepID=UPI0011789563|nr:hypothetical protein [Amycolatopsis keratiniphila]
MPESATSAAPERPPDTCPACGQTGGRLTGGVYRGRRSWPSGPHQHSHRYRCNRPGCGRRWSHLVTTSAGHE